MKKILLTTKNKIQKNEKIFTLVKLFLVRLQVFVVAFTALVIAKYSIKLVDLFFIDQKIILSTILGSILGAIVSIVFVYCIQRYIDKTEKTVIELLFEKNFAHNIILGAVYSFLLVGFVILILLKTHHLEVFFNNHLDIETGRAIVIGGINMFILAFIQEMIFRGYAISRLRQFFQPIAALAAQSLYFTLSSSIIFSFFLGQSLGGFNVFYYVSIFVFSFFFGLIRMRTHSLWFIIAFHAVWNFMQEGVFSITTDGQGAAIFKTPFLHHSLWSDTSGNIEGGWIVLVMVIVITVVMYLKNRKHL